MEYGSRPLLRLRLPYFCLQENKNYEKDIASPIGDLLAEPVWQDRRPSPRTPSRQCRDR